MKKYALFILPLMITCHKMPDNCYNNGYKTLKEYDVNFNQKTPRGILVDSTGQDIDLNEIDRQTAELEQCLGVSISRSCFAVKIPDDWETSACSGEQLLNIPAPDELCRAKGVEPTPECPCRWRVETMDDNIIVVTPNLKLFKAELARIVTGQNNVWIVPQITRCL